MAPLLLKIHTYPILLRAARFALIGLLGTLLDFALFSLLHLGVGLPSLPANTISYSAGIVNNFLFHRSWTFAERRNRSARQQFARFAAVSLSALALNNLVVLLLTPVFASFLPAPAFAAVLAKLCAVAIGMAWNFAANHFWTFRAA